MSEQTVEILIRLLLRGSLIRIYTVCHSFYIFWRHYFLVKLNCFILRTTTVYGLGVPIFRVFTVNVFVADLSCSVLKKYTLPSCICHNMVRNVKTSIVASDYTAFWEQSDVNLHCEEVDQVTKFYETFLL